MKKFNVILDETTIINFEFFFSLLKRYYVTTLITPILVFSIAYYKLGKQTTYFSQSISMKNTQVNSGNSATSLAELLGEKSDGITSAEIINITKSLDFRQELAEMIYKLPNFSQLQFTKNKATQFSHCSGEAECIIHVLRGTLSKLYTFEESRTVDSVLYLKYNALHAPTGKIILENIVKLISKTRISEIRHNIFKTKEITVQLIQEKRKALKDAKYEEKTEWKNKIVNDVKTIQSEILTVSKHLTRQNLELQYAESEFEQTTKVTKNLSAKEKQDSKKYVLLNEKVDELRADIRALETEQKTDNDRYILSQLKTDLQNKLKKINKFKNTSKLEKRSARFISSKDGSIHSKKFNYQLIKKQINKLESKLAILSDKKSELIAKLESISNQLHEYLPVIEYLELLEKKVIQLDLLLATIVSDLSFAKNYTDIVSYKKLKPSRTYTFSLVISIFIIFSLTFSRYLVDTRVYTEYELEKNFEDIEIIGRTPEFK